MAAVGGYVVGVAKGEDGQKSIGAAHRDTKVGFGSLEEINKAEAALQASRLADAEQLAHHKAQVAGSGHHFVPLVDLLQTTQPTASGSACFTHVGEAPFDQLAAFLLQSFAAVCLHATSVGVNSCFVFRRLVAPATFVSRVRFGNVGP